ncbi:uncharacterized protein LOC127436889 isoform X2 [Myxocyprinus asiaticus]|uniref:uncharacterized protein LOC127436889 isoform X2 n=1 Tax=Myxocyprinus asiaticus TaxID=70543 RepID=UPI0022235D34|nr:uncharacterized protein LOC127436889 isoform X2 [Myxocyprinus asiaticus]
MPPLSESKVFRKCVWTHEFGPQLQVVKHDLCKDLHSGTDYKEPEILSLEPNKVSFRGRNRVLLRGTNLESVTKIHIRGDLDCIPKESIFTSGLLNCTVSLIKVIFFILSLFLMMCGFSPTIMMALLCLVYLLRLGIPLLIVLIISPTCLIRSSLDSLPLRSLTVFWCIFRKRQIS